MTPGTFFVLWIYFYIFLVFTKGESTEVSCQLGQSCILPCTFIPGDEPVIHWIQGSSIQAHSYYNDNDQLVSQEHSFKGRTSLYKDQIPKGNASLLLKGVKIQDEGNYKCYSSTLAAFKDFFVNLKVEAPVSRVDIKTSKDKLTCSSMNIYPRPVLSWSTNPPSDTSQMNADASPQQTEEKLYNIISILKLTDNNNNQDFICTVSTPTSNRKATFYKPVTISESTADTTLSCTNPNNRYASIEWKFNDRVIVTHKNKDSFEPSAEWKKNIKDLTSTGNLELKDLSPEQNGIYSCELSDAENTYRSEITLELSKVSKRQTTEVAVRVVVPIIVIAVIVITIIICAFNKDHLPCLKSKQKDSPNGTRKSVNGAEDSEKTHKPVDGTDEDPERINLKGNGEN